MAFIDPAELYREEIAEHGEAGAFFVLLGLLLSFLFFRTSARIARSGRVSWWPGSVTTEGGLHVHHVVFGIALALVAGFLGFTLTPESPWLEILAAAFGIGAGLTLDEFALVLHLDDVYWTDEGRASMNAVAVAMLFGVLVMLGFSPFEQGTGAEGVATALIVNFGFAVITLLKGKLAAGVLGVFVPPVALVGAIRIAKPGSPWAHWFYARNEEKAARSQKRFPGGRKTDRLAAWLREAIAGSPDESSILRLRAEREARARALQGRDR